MSKIYNSNNPYELEQFCNLVSECILQKKLSLFIGAGSSMQYGAMDWTTLIKNIYECNLDFDNTSKAQFAELNGIDIKNKVAKITSDLKIDCNKINTFLYHLLNFDYESIWTTNYDKVIEYVLNNKGKSFLPVYQYTHFKNLSFPNSNFLYKINGSCTKPDSIVITHEDFINYRRSHEAYLILLKRELVCNSFLFLGCSFDDDILRICIKDILNCIDNSNENYSTEHYAVITEKNKDKMEFITKDLRRNYNINCLQVNNLKNSYMIAYGNTCKVKFNSIFISGAKMFERYSKEENYGKQVCRDLVDAFMKVENSPFKFISGMGMSIGHFVCGTIKKNINKKNLNRYLQMEPFPFTTKEANDLHRVRLTNMAGVFIFIYGDIYENQRNIIENGMWIEYLEAKKNNENIIVPIPCGENTVSSKIYEKEKKEKNTFSYEYRDFIEKFDYTANNKLFFEELVTKVNIVIRKKLDNIFENIVNSLKDDI